MLREPNPRPLGVPLDELEEVLKHSNLGTSRRGDTLIIQHEKYASTVAVVPPANRKYENDPIRAVVQVKTPIPEELCPDPSLVGIYNRQATLGALIVDGEKRYIGSRLTIYEQEDAWNLHCRLLLAAADISVNSMLGAVRRVVLGEGESEGGSSEWTEDDLRLVESQLSKFSFCNAGAGGLTAEFPLKRGAFSAMAGDRETALWQLLPNEPHPDLGGGLCCLLQLPHRIEDEARFHRVVNELNQLEMLPADSVPHFGAWCSGKDNKPAYVSFLPNSMRKSPKGIAVSFSHWARHRAVLANWFLNAMGIKLGRR